MYVGRSVHESVGRGLELEDQIQHRVVSSISSTASWFSSPVLRNQRGGASRASRYKYLTNGSWSSGEVFQPYEWPTTSSVRWVKNMVTILATAQGTNVVGSYTAVWGTSSGAETEPGYIPDRPNIDWFTSNLTHNRRSTVNIATVSNTNASAVGATSRFPLLAIATHQQRDCEEEPRPPDLVRGEPVHRPFGRPDRHDYRQIPAAFVPHANTPALDMLCSATAFNSDRQQQKSSKYTELLLCCQRRQPSAASFKNALGTRSMLRAISPRRDRCKSRRVWYSCKISDFAKSYPANAALHIASR